MSDQGAGGGIESGHMSTHTRSKSDNDAVPTEAPVETGSPSAEADEQAKFAQDHPRRLIDQRQTATPPVHVQDTLSRNPSTASSSTPFRSSRDYFARSAPRPLEPPVTKATLSELDVTKIIHNPKLRHDINFDPELHFRPNLDGEKGRRKQEKANQFWSSLRDQLIQFVMDRETFMREHPQGDDWCLPSLLKSVKEIIQTLVPQRDRDFLNEGLNVELLMQQFNRGIADLEKLASWLSSVLKLHCAPMRDEWVDEMYNELSNGNRNNDMGELVKGMRSLLSVLEAMKLDVANHQIRCLRPVLIEDTVHFEQRFFYKKITAGKISIRDARQWYSEAVQFPSRMSAQNLQAFGETAAFFDGLTRLILPSTPVNCVPNTFLFDEERILKLRSDMLDAINLEICMRLYEDLERVSRGINQGPPSFAAPTSVPSYVAGEPNSRPASFASSDCGSNTSSPRNSGYLASQSQVDVLDARVKARNLYESLLALLHTAPPASRPIQRWEGLVQSLAIQIFRFTDAPQDMLPNVESKLQSQLCDFQSDLYRQVEEHFQAKMLSELGKRVKDFRNLSGVGLFSVATGGRIHGPGRTWDGGRESQRERELLENSIREAREEGGVEDMATRLAHLGILHWRVWSQLVYLGDPNVDVAIGA